MHTVNRRDARPRVVVVVGPTGSGKTELALRLAKRFGGEIIAADSRTVYRGMNIGTAKPSRGDAAAIPHHLLDLRDPDESYTVAEFQADAARCIRAIAARKHLPIVVGGTGLYVQALVDNLEIPPVVADSGLRATLIVRPLSELLGTLEALDPDTAHRIDRRNPRRVVRALEVCLATGQPLSRLRRRRPPEFPFLEIGIELPRAELYRRIDARLDAWFAAGLIDEVRGLVHRYGRAIESLRGLVYGDIVRALAATPALGDPGAEEAVMKVRDRIRSRLHAYARHQVSWFHRDPKVQWVEYAPDAEALVELFLHAPPDRNVNTSLRAS